uniref:CYCLIN domain-containing protein n=1 Tax=Panagrellus redivivus TaxID=6233 RepID=A0A7E4VG97_PANRE
MYATSSHKRHWIFANPEALAEQRRLVNERFVSLRQPYIAEDDNFEGFPNSEEELVIVRVVSHTGVRFANEFKPTLPLPVRWIAFMYFKRFYTKVCSLQLNTAPKRMMMVCFFLAAKVYEFNISTSQFVSNLRSGDAASNADNILKLEPKLMEELNYELTVHTPYKAFEGHLLEMKARMSLLGFDLEQLRPHAMEFFEKAMIGDAMLLYAPTHIALAALKYALEKCDKSVEILKDFFYRFLDLDAFNSREEDREQVQKVLNHVGAICDMVLQQGKPIPANNETADIKRRIHDVYLFATKLDERLRNNPSAQQTEEGNDSDSD